MCGIQTWELYMGKPTAIFQQWTILPNTAEKHPDEKNDNKLSHSTSSVTNCVKQNYMYNGYYR